MTIEEKLKSIIIERYGNVATFNKKIDMANSTFATIMKNGIHKANVSSIIKICKELDISADELANDRIVPNRVRSQTKSHITELSELVKYAKMNFSAYSDITLDGKTLTNSELNTFIDLLDFSIELIRRNRERNKENETIQKG